MRLAKELIREVVGMRYPPDCNLLERVPTQQSGLAEEEMKVWKRLATRAIGRAIGHFSPAGSRYEVKLASIELRSAPARDIIDVLGGPESITVGIYSSFSGKTSGCLLLAHQPQLLCLLSDIILQNAPGTSRGLVGIKESVLGEVSNVLGSSFLDATSDLARTSLRHSPSMVFVDMATSIMEIALVDVLEDSNYVIAADTVFLAPGYRVDSKFLLAPSPTLTELVIGRQMERHNDREVVCTGRTASASNLSLDSA